MKSFIEWLSRKEWSFFAPHEVDLSQEDFSGGRFSFRGSIEITYDSELWPGVPGGFLRIPVGWSASGVVSSGSQGSDSGRRLEGLAPEAREAVLGYLGKKFSRMYSAMLGRPEWDFVFLPDGTVESR